MSISVDQGALIKLLILPNNQMNQHWFFSQAFACSCLIIFIKLLIYEKNLLKIK